MLSPDDYIGRVKHLPPAPRLLPELLTLLARPDVDSSRVVTVMTYDPALTAHVLRLCSSAFFSASSPVTDLNEAVFRLGFQQVYRLVAAVCGSQILSTGRKGSARDGDLWKHSVVAALAAQVIATGIGDDASLVFTATLLHDVGKLVFAEALEGQYSNLQEETASNQQSLLDAEKLTLGVHHAEVGGRLLERWKFAPDLVTAVTFHHTPADARGHDRLAAFIYLGDMLAYFMGHGYGEQAFALRGRKEALHILKLESRRLPEFMGQAFEQLSTLQSLFQGGAGAR